MSDRRRRREDKREKKRRRSSSSTDERSRRRRRAGGSGWDKAPASTAMVSGFTGISARPDGPGPLAITAGPGGALVAAQAAQPTPSSAGSAQDPNARRLYIGNVPASLSDEMVENYFKMHATALRYKLYHKRMRIIEEMGQDTSLVPKPNDALSPVEKCSVTRSSDPGRSGFAFVELDDEDLTTECLSLDSKPCPLSDGTMIQLKVCRPKNYVAPSAPPLPSWMRPSGDAITLPAHAKGRLVMTGIPDSMPDVEIKELLDSFGSIANYQLLAEADGASRACCVFDYEDEDDDDKAINALNGLDIGTDVLNVRKVGAGALVLHAGNAPSPDDLSREEHEDLILKTLANVSKPLHEVLLLLAQCQQRDKRAAPGTVAVKKPTKILALLNMFDSEDLENTESFEQLRADIETEVEKYGRVVALTIPRDYPPPPPKRQPPAKPDMLLEPQVGSSKSAQVLAITQGGEGGARHTAPLGYALDPNTDALIPLNKLEDEKKRIHNENSDRLRRWEAECLELERNYAEQKRRWEREIQDPIKNGVGKVFVEYWTADEAHKAQVALAGRQFDGRTVITSFVPEEWMFESKDNAAESFEDIMKSLEAGEDVLGIEDKPSSQ